MKLSSIAVLLFLVFSSTTAFVLPQHSSMTTKTSTKLSATTTTTTFLSRRTVLIQGLVATNVAFLPTTAMAERPAYLTEPTEEFKANEAKAAVFNQQQREVKAKFTVVIDRLATVSMTEEELVRDLKELTDYVYRTGGLPTGIKKEDLYKTIRRKKAAGFWPTPVEVAYVNTFVRYCF
jgi:hypothetical protein